MLGTRLGVATGAFDLDTGAFARAPQGAGTTVSTRPRTVVLDIQTRSRRGSGTRGRTSHVRSPGKRRRMAVAAWLSHSAPTSWS